jgi:acetolactate synthase-1/2/3 large subunit
MKLVDALVGALRDWGVRFVFGVSGANIEHLHDAIHRLGGGELESVLAKSEVGAAFMADARARIHGTLGVCCATSGGGMMNLAVGIAEAYAESVPVLAIVGQIPSTLEGAGGFQDSSGIGRTVDALAMWRAMTKSAERVESANGFWEKLARAARAALEGRPGPAVLLVTRDAYDLEVPSRPAWFPGTLADLVRPRATATSSIVELLGALRTARRPVILLGAGASRSTGRAAIVRFAIEARIPVVTTMADPAAFPNDHPLYFGTVGAAGHPSAHAYLNERADLIVAVGTELPAMIRQPLAPALARCRLAVVSVDARELPCSLVPWLSLEGDPAAVFRELRRAHTAAPFMHPPVAYTLTRYVPELAEATPPVSRSFEGSSAAGLLQSEAIEILGGRLPEGGHVLFDAGNCAAAAIHGMFLPRGATSTIALGMGGMGYAIAGAIGAQIGAHERARTVVLCGDGAFLMLGFEIHTAVERRLPILFVVFNNAKHGMCVTRQGVYFEGRVEASAYERADLATVARGLADPSRLWVGRATTAARLREALDAYERSPGRPGVLELVLMQEEMPPFAPFLRQDHPTYAVARPGIQGCIEPAA